MADATSHAPHRAEPTGIQETDTADSTAHARHLFDLAVAHSGMSYWTLDLETDELYVSPEWKKQLGYEEHEIQVSRRSLPNLFHPDDLDLTRDEWEQFVDHGTSAELEYRLRHKDGSYRLMLARISVNRRIDGKPSAVFGSHWDITERKEAEHKLRSLAIQIEDSKLEERRRLSHDLHDYLAQILIACTMKIQTMDPIGISDQNAARLSEVIGLIKEAEEYTRTLIARLSPDVLYNLGLVPALDLLAGEIRSQSRIVVDIRFSGPSIDLPTESALFVFETVRELLNNIARHAQAEYASVNLQYEEGQLAVSVVDNGDGFDTSRLVDAHHDKHFGLFSINHRLSARDGNVEIQSTIGEGTRIFFRIPIVAIGADDKGVTLQSI